MKKHIEHDLIMLPSKERTNILLNTSSTLKYASIPISGQYHINQHLYITSNDEIKEGDWCLPSQKDTFDRIIPYQYKEGNAGIGDKKIIATTDILHPLGQENITIPEAWDTLLPQIPQQFIEHYITEYNKGNIITKILIEYEQYGLNSMYLKGCTEINCGCHSYKVIINSDNTINIKPIEVKMYSREEVIEKITKAISDTNKINKRNVSVIPSKWIEENL